MKGLIKTKTHLVTTHDSGLCAIVIIEKTFTVSTLAIGTPDGLLGVVRLEHVSPLHVHGDDEIGGWVGVGLTGLS